MASSREKVWDGLLEWLDHRRRFLGRRIGRLFDLDDGGTHLVMETHAAFRETVAGRAYRWTVLGTGAHVVAVRRMLRQIRRRADPDRGECSRRTASYERSLRASDPTGPFLWPTKPEEQVPMPIPAQYQRATEHFYELLIDARDAAGLETTHAAYTMVQGVLQVFRRRLALGDAIRFAGVLPPVVRSLFVAEWDPDEPRRPFGSRAAMTREAQALRSTHNYAPDTCIRDVAEALRRHTDQDALDRVLRTLPEGAAAFWCPYGETGP